MSKRTKQETERIAVHEAAHAVAAYIFHWRFTYVSIIRYRHEGAVKLSGSHKSLSKDQKHRHFMISQAGKAAELVFFHDLISSEEDTTNAQEDISDFADPEERAAYISNCYDDLIKQFTFPPWQDAIKALADALIERQKIGYLQARKIIKDAIR